MKVIYKFNGGKGAILCHRCSKIIKENITYDEASKLKLFFCSDECEKKFKNVTK